MTCFKQETICSADCVKSYQHLFNHGCQLKFLKLVLTKLHKIEPHKTPLNGAQHVFAHSNLLSNKLKNMFYPFSQFLLHFSKFSLGFLMGPSKSDRVSFFAFVVFFLF